MAKQLFGIIVVLLGVVFLLNNFDILDFEIGNILGTYWPLLIILLGVKESLEGLMHLITGLKRGAFHFSKLFWGLFILGIGIVFQGNELGYFHISVWNFIWPSIIIYLGLSIISGTKFVSIETRDGKRYSKDEYWNKYSVDRKKRFIGEIKYGGQAPWELEDLHLWNGIGEIDLDLTTAILKEGESMIDISGWIGDINVLVPQDLAIKINADVRVGEVNVLNHTQSGTSRFISYKSESYEQATKKINLMISLSIGEVNVKQVD